ncbi:MAG: hypothetical protein GY862_15835 [Gammaproteobacteria bacterium]|nr:hypothetical protein [Gammaproteobacteria bacterium]
MDKLHQEDGHRATFSYDKEWCLKQQCNEAAFAECKEIVKTPEEKKDLPQNRAKAAGSVQEIQVEVATSDKGHRRKDKKGSADNLVNEPPQTQIDNVVYRQMSRLPPPQQRYNPPLPPPPPPPPRYYYQDVPRHNLCPWAPDRNTYTNFRNNHSPFPPNYMSGSSERFPSNMPSSLRSFIFGGSGML